jgi:antitoxin (DNA-binding transcriptional repressor) of toxin-antitoxin stability system
MSTTLSVREAQTQLPELVAGAARDAEPCYIEHDGKAVAVLVSLRQWQQRGQSNAAAATTAAEEQERRISAYQEKMAQLGPDYWLPADQQARLKELVEKEELGAPLTSAEGKELRRLLKRHEQLMVKRASALHVMR